MVEDFDPQLNVLDASSASSFVSSPASSSASSSDLIPSVSDSVARSSSDSPSPSRAPPPPIASQPAPVSVTLEDAVSQNVSPSHVVPPVPTQSPLQSFAPSPTLPPVDEYLRRFGLRYRKEVPFRDIVHSYLHLSKKRKAMLAVTKHLLPPMYRSQTDKIIKEYATRVWTDAKEALALKTELDQLSTVEKETAYTEKLASAAEKERAEVVTLGEQAVATLEDRGAKAREGYALKLQEENLAAERAREEIERRTAAEEIVKERLRSRMAALPCMRVDNAGNLAFDEQTMVHKLEDMFLTEIISEIERDDGVGFLSNAQREFSSLITHWGELEDVVELDHIDYVQSIMLSRSRGYRLPKFPFLVAGKYDLKATSGRASVDTAISLDTSGSMSNNNRLTIAKKTTLAMHALMRQLNPANEVYLSRFSSGLTPITTLDLVKNVEPDGWTSTHLALNWLLDTLAPRGPSMAYLITDGHPELPQMHESDAIDLAERTAKRYRDFPHVRLRIFLIDGNDNAQNTIRRIGRAAGNGAKVIPVSNYQLAGGVLRDVSDVLRGMYDIDSW